MKNNKNYYDNRVVFKPWGYEYVVYRSGNNLSVTILNINSNKSTSLHCHPKKKNWFRSSVWKSVNTIRIMETRVESL